MKTFRHRKVLKATRRLRTASGWDVTVLELRISVLETLWGREVSRRTREEKDGSRLNKHLLSISGRDQ